jgi:tetratricopeptide (TPR) repeat protein
MSNIGQCDSAQTAIVALVKWQAGRRGISCGVTAALCAGAVTTLPARQPSQSLPERAALALERPTLADAQNLFYNARYEAAAALTLALRSSETEGLTSVELRTSALLFQLKVLLEGRPDKPDGEKDQALKNCTTCPGLIADFLVDIHRGQDMARTALRANPGDETALFFLGKLDLNYVWLQLGPLRRKTGWDEYWEARRSLDAVLKANPRNVRARIARAWIDYIVDTKMPWGTRWLLGGGNRKQALRDVREAAQMDSDFFTHTEAEFALWEMQVREGDVAHAIDAARRLARDFPENRQLAAFLEARVAGSRH